MTDSPVRTRAKQWLRRIAMRGCEKLLLATSGRMALCEEPAVVIAPHPDDESLGCGGIIARKRNEGLPVEVVFLTDGASSHPGHPTIAPTALAALRRVEALRAAAHLGVERSAVHFINEPDGTLPALHGARRENLITQLALRLRDVQPGEVFLPCNPDGSSEHDAAFGLVLEAIARSGARAEVWQYPVWAWWNPGMMMRCWWRARNSCRLPLEDYHHAKLAAIDCYQSQISPLLPDREAALPPELVRTFQRDTEFFFRYLPPRTP